MSTHRRHLHSDHGLSEELSKSFGAALLIIVLLPLIAFAQGSNPEDPKRGLAGGTGYSISDIENINLNNGNLMLNIPLVRLPKGRGNLGGWMGYVYNSKLYEPNIENILVSNEWTDQNLLFPSDEGGWRGTSSLDFRLKLTYRFATSTPIECTTEMSQYYWKNEKVWKLQVTMPDGNDKDFRPIGYTEGTDSDGYFALNPDGYARTVNYSTCSVTNTLVTTDPIPYYSADGSHIRLVVNPSNQAFTMYFPDGSYYESSIGRMTDRHGNWVQKTSFTYNGESASGIEDSVGHKIFGIDEQGEHDDELHLYQLGVDGDPIKWIVRRKSVYARREYQTTANGSLRARGGTSTQSIENEEFEVLDEIELPAELGGQKFEFGYNGSDTTMSGSQYSDGFGELNWIKLPSGAEVEYEYNYGTGNTDKILGSFVATKTLIYDAEYDGGSSEVEEIWTYAFVSATSSATVTSPDGSTMTEKHFALGDYHPLNGFVKSVEYANGTKVEKLWEMNSTPWGGSNPWVKMEFTSIKDGNGNYTLTAIKEFAQNKNGNTTSAKEYDFVSYANVPRDGSGHPTGLPSGSCSGKICPARTTLTTYNNSTPDSSDTSNATYAYWNFGSVKGVAATAEVQNSSNQTVSKTEFTYDNYSTTANPTMTRVWDNAKSTTITSPLTDSNSIKTLAEYDQYGNVTETTDAEDVETTITYGCIDGSTSNPCPSSAPGSLYPTKTEVASNHSSVKRTSSAIYDFYTGVVTTATDEDNDVSVVTVYDDLGRPTIVKNAYGTALESWTETEYFDNDRYVIVRSDLETKEDARKVGIQHFDQLGRVRLTRTLEDSSTQEAEDSCITITSTTCDGIKVQTRYMTVTGTPGYTYALTSNPYRASKSVDETDASMGWTRSKAWSTGIKQEVETFSGSGLPAPWGSNGTTTGKVVTDIYEYATTVTDQAGKLRRSITNGIGQLVRIDEPNASNVLGSVSSPNQPTNYTYDVLNNLLTVTQTGTGTEQCGPAWTTGNCSQTRTFTYSSLSRLLTADNPESGEIEYEYDKNGNLTEKTDARGLVTTYTYDALNRLTQRAYPEPSPTPADYHATPTVTYTYDDKTNAKGKLTKVSSSVSTTEYTTFDILGRVTASKQTTDGVTYGNGSTDSLMTYTYNLAGQLIEQQYPSGRKVQNFLDQNGDLEMVKSRKNANSGYWAYADNFTYNAAGAVTSMQLGNGTWESTAFNSRLQPTQIVLGVTQGATGLLKLDYSYGTTTNNGNVLTQTITVPTVGTNNGFAAVQTYNYDSLNRLKDATEMLTPNGGSATQSWKQTFMFDRYGNRNFDETNTDFEGFDKLCNGDTELCSELKKRLNPSINTSDNRLSTGDGYDFDDAGNTTSDPDDRTFIYDAENKQVEVKDDQNDTIGQYWYDGDGRRVKKYVPAVSENPAKVTIFVYDAAGKLVAEYSTIVASTNDAKVAYLTNDHLGSPRINTDKNGKVTARHDYHPFGEEIATSQRIGDLHYTDDTVRKQFTGYERDKETDLDFAQARSYSPSWGRFLSPDPENYGALESEPQSWNGYSYTGGNPVLYSDPDGLDYKVCYIGGAGCDTYTNEGFATYLKSIASAGQGFTAKGSANSGSIYDNATGEAIATFTYFTTPEQDRIRALVNGAYPLLSAAQPIVELVQPAPGPGGAVIGPIIKTTKVARVLQRAKWASGLIKYRHGTMTAIEHVIYRHGPKSGFANVGKFSSRTSLRRLSRMADEAVSNLNGSQVPNGNGFVYDFGTVVGTHADGTLTTKVQVYVNQAGEILTIFPVK